MNLLMRIGVFFVVCGLIAICSWIGGIEMFTDNAGVAAFCAVAFGGIAAAFPGIAK